MERFLIKREPNISQEIEEIVNIDNHMWIIDEKPFSIKLEYSDNNTSSTPNWCENYSEIKQELNFSHEEHPTHEFKNDDLEEIVDIDNHLIDKKPNNIKLEYIDNHTSSIPICSGKYSELKQELDRFNEDHSINNVVNVNLDNSLSKLRNVRIILERLSTVQILKYTKKSVTDPKYTYRLNVDAMKYVCVYFCSKCDRTDVDTKNIRHTLNRPECGCIPTMAYKCISCNEHYISYQGIQRHVNTKGFCKSRKRFLDLEGFNDDEWEKLNCPKCNVSLKNIAQFTEHVNNCEEAAKFWCSFCDYGSTRIDHFREHLKLHASQSTHSKSGFSSEVLAQNECDRKERSFPVLKTVICYCSTCDETLIKKGFRVSSTCNKCTTPYTYRCPKCKKEYLALLSVRIHIEGSCNPSKDYRCPICKVKEFACSDSLKRHMSHCGKTLYMHCKFCPFKTKHKRGLKAHLKIRHFEKHLSFIDGARDEGPLYDLFCEQCSEPKEHDEYRNTLYYCLKCKTNILLQCRKCNAVYKSRRSIMAHITSNCGLKIEGKLEKCPKCDRQFQNLKLHVNYCRDLTKYCAHCPYNTKKKYHLERHLFCKHQDEF